MACRDAWLARLHALRNEIAPRLTAASQAPAGADQPRRLRLPGQRVEPAVPRRPGGGSDAAEPSAAEIAALIRQLREEQARALFVENIRDPRLIELIAAEAEAGARVGGSLYSDVLTVQGPTRSYLGMYRQNIERLLEVLAVTGWKIRL